MKRRTFLKTAGVGMAGAVSGCATLPQSPQAAASAATPEKPNILFIFSDQQRHDTVGCYGDDTMGAALNLTPNLDKMAAEGVRFAHAITAQPVCGPTRSCLQTGLYATQTGCYRNDVILPLDAVTLPRLLKPAGYEVGYLGKWHLASQGEEHDYRTKAVPLKYRGGYDDFWLASDVLEFTSHGYDGHMFDAEMNQVEFPKGRYRVDAQTDFAIDYLRSRDGEKPFFLFLSYIEPHHQNDHRHYEGPKGSKEKFKDYPVPGDLEGTEGNWREEMPDYLGCCNALDTAVGRLREELEALGMAENTLIVYTSDHACHFKTRNGEYKRSCHENSVRVPMIIHGPGFQGGKVQDEIVSLMDLPPTLLAAGGATVPEAFQGRPLQELVQGESEDWRDEAFIQISESQVGRAIRTQRWKYGVDAPDKKGWEHSGSESYVEQYLYDLRTDPHERHNLVAESALKEVRNELRKRLIARMVEAGEDAPEIH